MRIAYIILVLIVAIVTAVFAVENSAAITLKFFGWSITGSIPLLLVVTLAIGFFLGMLLMVPSVYKRGRLAAGLKKKIHRIEKETEERTKAQAGEPGDAKGGGTGASDQADGARPKDK